MGESSRIFLTNVTNSQGLPSPVGFFAFNFHIYLTTLRNTIEGARLPAKGPDRVKAPVLFSAVGLPGDSRRGTADNITPPFGGIYGIYVTCLALESTS
jgi:hypothetical protein